MHNNTSLSYFFYTLLCSRHKILRKLRNVSICIFHQFICPPHEIESVKAMLVSFLYYYNNTEFARFQSLFVTVLRFSVASVTLHPIMLILLQ